MRVVVLRVDLPGRNATGGFLGVVAWGWWGACGEIVGREVIGEAGGGDRDRTGTAANRQGATPVRSRGLAGVVRFGGRMTCPCACKAGADPTGERAKPCILCQAAACRPDGRHPKGPMTRTLASLVLVLVLVVLVLLLVTATRDRDVAPEPQVDQFATGGAASREVPAAVHEPTVQPRLPGPLPTLSGLPTATVRAADREPGRGPVALDAFSSHLLDLKCASVRPGCGEAYGDPQGCRAFHAQRDPDDWEYRLLRVVHGGRVRYDPAAARECLTDLRARCPWTTFGRQSEPASCGRAFAGTVAAGQDCKYDAECLGGYCPPTNDDAPRRCSPRQAVGGPCQESDACQKPLVCEAGACIANSPAGEGEPCKGRGTCLAGLACVHRDTDKVVCLKALGPGQACVYSEDACAPSFRCNEDFAGRFRCLPRVGIGQPCEGNEQCPGHAADCVGSAGARTCQRRPALGEPCRPGAEPECMLLAECHPKRHRCAIRPSPGEPCDGVVRCFADLPCRGGICVLTEP